jgi:hypothetical protein
MSILGLNSRRSTSAARLLLAALSVVALAACGTHRTKTTTGTSILGGDVQPVSFAQVRSAVDALYRSDHGMSTFTVRSVAYTPATRDTVLAVCRRGGASSTARELESSRVAACAPLIFFYYRYGRHASSPDAIDLARKLYWYAATNVKGPFDAKRSLAALLSGWGVK